MLMSEKEYNTRLIKKQYRGTFFGALVVLLLARYSDLRCDKSEIDDESIVLNSSLCLSSQKTL